MRRIILILVLSATVNVFGQTWFQTGNKWWYNTYDITSGNGIYLMQIVGDTIFQGKNCKVLQPNGIGLCTFGSDNNYIFLYSDSDKVSYFNNALNKFCHLYDFTKLPGDTFYVQLNQIFQSTIDSVGFIIDSIGFTNIDTFHLRTQYLTPIYSMNNLIGHYGNNIEFIGHTSFLFPVDFDMCDASYTGGLICYYDSVIDYHPNTAYSCNVYDVDEVKPLNGINVFPNPTSDNINIDIDGNNINLIRLYDIFGRLVATCDKSNLLDMSSLSNGIYVIEITDKKNNTTKIKIIKNAS